MLGAPFGSSARIVTRTDSTDTGFSSDDAIDISISSHFI
jgi:hypothetical protein